MSRKRGERELYSWQRWALTIALRQASHADWSPRGEYGGGSQEQRGSEQTTSGRDADFPTSVWGGSVTLGGFRQACNRCWQNVRTTTSLLRDWEDWETRFSFYHHGKGQEFIGCRRVILLRCIFILASLYILTSFLVYWK